MNHQTISINEFRLEKKIPFLKLKVGLFYFNLLFFITTSLFAQSRVHSKYVISNFNLDQGLPQSSVTHIIQSSDGYIWMSTFGGLVRFDGVKFEVFDRANSPGMLSDRAISVFEDNEKRLWAGTEEGLLCYEKGKFITYGEKEGLNNVLIVNGKEDTQGNLWVFAADNSVYKMINGKFYKQTISEDKNLIKIAIKGKGEFFHFIGTKILRLIDGRLVAYVDMGVYGADRIWDVLEKADGTLYVATGGQGLFVIAPGKPGYVKKYTKSDGLFSNDVKEIIFDEDGNIWAAGMGGVSSINLKKEKSIYTITEGFGVSNLDISCTIQDREGNYWVGSNTNGVYKLRKSIFTIYTAENGLKQENLLSLCCMKDGNVLIGTNCSGIYELKDERVYFSKLNKYFKDRCTWSVFEDSKKRIWISTNGLLMVNGNKAKLFSAKDGFTSNSVFAIYEDKGGRMWIGCHDGLFKYSHNIFTKYTIRDGLTSNDVRSIFEDRDGNLWVGTVNGLNKMAGAKIIAYPAINGSSNIYIRAIYQDKDGVMWFGTYGGGLIRLKDNKFSIFTKGDGMFDNIVSQIVEDRYGYFWMGCNRGISRVSRKELNEYADGKIKMIKVTSYGKQDGLLTVETNGGFQPNAVTNKDGRIYFPTVKGLVSVNPANVHNNKIIPPVYIEKFLVEGKDRKIAPCSISPNQNNEAVQISPDSSDVQINFTSLSFVDPQKVHFKYRLEGADNKWKDAGTMRFAVYRNLPPGNYKFTVIACNNAGVWNEKGASIAFTIVPPFWMTWWFRALVIITLISTGPIIYYRRVAALKTEGARQQEFSQKLIESQEAERKRIAVELHDGLGQNLLIIKNKLNSGIKNFGLDDAKFKLEEAESFVKKSINEVRAISKNLSPYLLDQLGLTTAIETMIENVEEATGIIIKTEIYNIDGVFKDHGEINIYRIIQESLNNIVKHSEAKNVVIKIINKEGAVRMSVNDDGKGFDIESEKSKKGFGLAGLKERVSILKGEMKIASGINSGTKLSFVIPVEKKA